MTVIDLLSRVRERRIELFADGERLRVRAPEGALTADLQQELSAQKAEILAILKHGTPPEGGSAITPVPRSTDLPLSFAQERFWFLEQLEPGTSANHIAFGIRFNGALNVEAVRASLQEIVNRHEVLRTTIVNEAGQARLAMTSAIALDVPFRDVSGEEPSARWARATELAFECAHRPFDLARGPLVRAELVRLDAHEHVLVLALHHIVFDGWSVGVLADEFGTLYKAFAAGEPSPLGMPRVHYADFAVRQREWVASGRFDLQRDYWKRQLADLSPLQVPTDRPRPKVRTFHGAQEPVMYDAALMAALEALSRREGVTLFMTLLAAYQTLLHRYTGQDDIVVGTAIAGRTHPDLEPLMGPFINSLAMRTDLSGDPGFTEVLRRVRHVALGAYAHQDLPFERLVDELQPDRDLGRNPLFQVIFAVQNVPLPRLELQGLTVGVMDIERTTSAVDIDWLLWRTPEGIQGFVRYSTELFDRATIRRMLGHFETLLRAIVHDPSRRISELTILGEEERHLLLVEWNRTDVQSTTDATVPALVARRAAAHPEGVAAVGSGGPLTYGDLDARATQLGSALRGAGVGPECVVAVVMERSPAMLVALLGVLKSGAAYVPIDPGCPADRLAFMLTDTGTPVVLTHASVRDRIPEGAPAVWCLDGEHDRLANGPTGELPAAIPPDGLAYVIYTSGSTGQPKGVEVTHRGLLNLVRWHNRRYAITADDRATQIANVAFDASVWEIWPYLAAGASVSFPGADTTSEPAALWRWMAAERITVAFVPTPLAEAMLREPPSSGLALRALLTGGDRLQRGPSFRLPFAVVNHYGPTENSVVTTCGDVEVAGPGDPPPPIGRPIDNVRAYVLDRRQQPVPIGIPGELYIGGPSLARGYLRRPHLTAERFVPNPFDIGGDSRLYRTGDVVRYLPDGNLQFLGRNDEQVKVRGFRIELGEIEQVLRQHPAVREAIVIVREYGPGDRRLLGYLTLRDPGAAGEALLADIRSSARQKLPEYMVPAAILVLDALPLTANGKLDRRALPDPEIARRDRAEEVESPRNSQEQALADVWARVLHVERVGIHENFFDLGGDSILSLQIVGGAAERGLRLTPRQIFEHPTIAELAALVPAVAPAEEAHESGTSDGTAPLTPIQCWFFDQHFPDPAHFNQAVLVEPREKLDPVRLERAVARVVERHDALRFRYEPSGAAWRQTDGGVNGHVPFERVDMSGLPSADWTPAMTARAAAVQASFDLSAGPLLKVVLFDLGAQPDRLLLVAHHLVVDTVSWRILLGDLQRAYEQGGRPEPLRLSAKTTSFRAWAERLHEHANSLLDELPHWESVADAPLVPCPRDRHAGPNTVASTRAVSIALDAAATRSLLQDVPKVYGTRINEVLLTAVARSFERWTGQSTLLIDLEGHGREALFDDLDLTQTVGWFTTVYPVLLDVRGARDTGASLKRTKERLRRIPQNGIGYGMLRYLVDDPQVSRRLARIPQPEIGFNYLGQFDNVFDGMFKAAAEPIGSPISPRAPRVHVIEMSGRVAQGRLHMTYLYSENLHAQTTIETLAAGFVDSLHEIIRHCQAPEAGGYTPSDFPEAKVNQEQLDRLLARLGGRSAR